MEGVKKYARSTNFTPKEENVLLSLVKKYKNVIECKKTDTITNKVKANAWIQITKEYNSTCAEFHRDVKTLKNKYDNIKKRTKQKFADHKQYVKGTGGGPAKDIIVTTTHNDIYEIIGSQLTGLSSEFDDDVVGETIHISTSDSVQFEVIDMDTDCDENNVCTKRTPSKGSIGYKLEEWVASKVGLADIQQKCFLEEHNLKLKQMKERHEQQLKLQKKETDQRSKKRT